MTGSTSLTFMGTGTSQGVPIIGCRCEVCSSPDPRDKRLRSSAFVRYRGLNILVDAGPDFRTQMIREGTGHLDAILLTHNHMDHIGGLDDVRALNYIDRKPVHIFCESKVLESLREMFAYAFAKEKYPGSPEWRIHLIDEKPFAVSPNDGGELVWMHDQGYCTRMPDGSIVPCGNDIISQAVLAPDAEAGDAIVVPIRGFHGQMPILGFRFGDIAYLTDMSSIPEEEMSKLKGLKHLTLNTVSYHKHHSHFCLDEALSLAREIGAEHTWLTHLSHAFPRYERFLKELPAGVEPAWDGLVING